MPNRIIKESICTSDTIDQLTAEEERFFCRLLVQADDFGRYDGRASVVLAGTFPLRAHEIGLDRVEAWLQRLAEVDLIRFYYVGGRRYLYFTTWDKHQQKRAKYSKYPDPPSDDEHMISDDIRRESPETKCPRETRNENTRNEKRETTDETRARENGEQDMSVCPSVDDPLSIVTAAYHAHIGVLGPTQFGCLRHWHDEMLMPAEVIVEAILEAGEAGNRRIDYINGILTNWHNDGVRTAEEARIRRRPRFEAAMTKRSRASPSPLRSNGVDEMLARLTAEEAAL